jgi:membrane protease YdiL (CAAX protease family)
LPGLKAEVLVVLGLSLGQSAIYALLRLVDRLTETVSLGEQTVAMNTSDNAKPWLDLIYQLVGVALALIPVALALYLLAARPGFQEAADVDAGLPADSSNEHGGHASGPWRTAARGLGLDLTRPGRDLAWGAALTAAIGLPGIGVYLIGRQLGITASISTANLGQHWWTIPVLILLACQNGLLEEVVAVGYLSRRLDQAGWRLPAILAASALLRASYHLYQGFGSFVGNAAMGVVFAWYFWRTRRVMPLVVAHSLMDVVAFIGPTLLDPAWLT